MPTVVRFSHLAILVAALAGAGCTTAISGRVENIARLERARAADPESPAVQRSLGIAYFSAKRYDDARAALQHATSADPRDGVAALYLGLTAEAQRDLATARSAYESYLRVGKTRGVKNQISARLAIVAREENALAVQQALARERELASEPGSPLTIAVLPFTFTGSDTSLKPLERGFAELVATDLTRSSRLTVVDRARLQALLDDIGFASTRIEAVDMTWTFATTDDYWNFLVELTALGPLVRSLPNEARETVKSAIDARLVPFTRAAGIALPSRCWCGVTLA